MSLRNSPLIVMGCFLVLCALIGFSSTVLLLPFGPHVVGAGMVMGLSFAWIGMTTTFVSFGRTKNSRFPAVMAGLLYLLVLLLFPIILLSYGHQFAANKRVAVKKVQGYGLAHFDKMDADRSGIITQRELRSFIKAQQLPISKELQVLQNDIRDIGHQVGDGDEYVIDRRDLTEYADRAIDKWKRW